MATFRTFLSVVILLFVTQLTAQTYELTPRYRIGSTYKTDTKSNITTTINYPENPELESQLKMMGMEPPLKMIIDSDMNVSIKAVAKDDRGIALVFSYDDTKMVMSGSMFQMQGNTPDQNKGFVGANIYAHYVAGNKTELDSIVNISDPKLKASLEQTLQSTLQNASFPDQILAIGDTFTVVASVKSQLSGGKTLGYSVDSKYTLIRVEGDHAYLTGLISVVSDSKENSLAMSGSGTTTMTFNVKEDFVVESDSQISMTMTMVEQGMKVETLTSTKALVKTTKVE